MVLFVYNVLGQFVHVNPIYKQTINQSVAEMNVEEYCTLETFRPKCSTDEVIIITHAYYGAMRIGKCIETDKIGMCIRRLFIYIPMMTCTS